jgi:hypothetical protein
MKNNTGLEPDESRRSSYSMTTGKMVVGVVVLSGIATALVLEHQAQQLRQQNRTLQNRIEQLAPFGTEGQPAIAAANSNSLLSEEQHRELLRLRGQSSVLRQQKDELGKLHADNRRLGANLANQLLERKAQVTLAQLAPYLEAKQRNAESLLAAFHVTGDPTALREALEKYPADPRVNFAAAFKSDTPEERRQRLEALKQSAPDNALANYLSAQDYFKNGQSDLALHELAAAAAKPKFESYAGDFVQSLQEAYWAAGCSTAGAGLVAAYSSSVEQLSQLRGLGNNLGELATLYRQAGDEASAQTALQMGLTLGRQVSEPFAGKPTCLDLLGIEIEKKFLAAMDPASPYGSSGITVQDRVNELARKRETIKDVGGDAGIWVNQALSEQDQISFFDRMKVSGELEALRWARTRQTKP